MEYKLPEIYDAGGNIKKQWFVFYSFRNPHTGKFKRYRVLKDINSAKTKESRYERCKYYVTVYREWLESGGSPEATTADARRREDQNIIICIDKFIEFVRSSKMRDNTKHKYDVQLTVFKRWLIDNDLAGLVINEIKKQMVFDYIQYVKKRPNINSGKTINDYINNLARFFNHYIDNYDDFLERNPATKISREMVEMRGNVAFTDAEFAAIKKCLLERDPYLWFVCEVIYYTGLRNEAEALEIKIGDFDFNRDHLMVYAWVAKNKIKQSVPIYPEFKELLLSLEIDKLPHDWYLFGSGNKPGIKRVGAETFSRRFCKIKKILGLGREYGLYCCKSTRACHLYDDGAEIREIQRLFRHSDPLITMTYLKSLGRVERDRVYDKGRRI